MVREHFRLGNVDVPGRFLANGRAHAVVGKDARGRDLHGRVRLCVTGELERLCPLAICQEQRDDGPLPSRVQSTHRRPELGNRIISAPFGMFSRHLILELEPTCTHERSLDKRSSVCRSGTSVSGRRGAELTPVPASTLARWPQTADNRANTTLFHLLVCPQLWES